MGSDGRPLHFIGIQRDISGTMAEKKARFLLEMASHELGTPLTVIKGTLQILQQRGMSVESNFMHKSFAAALRAVDRLEQLGRDMLAKT